MYKVEYGSIYNDDYSMMIDNLAIIVHKTDGICGFGDKYMHNMPNRFAKKVQKFRDAKLDDRANSLVYIEFDRYDGVLSVEETCVLLNHMVFYTLSGERILSLLDSDEKTIKETIKEFKHIQDSYNNRA